jgi:hypothetical protein
MILNPAAPVERLYALLCHAAFDSLFRDTENEEEPRGAVLWFVYVVPFARPDDTVDRDLAVAAAAHSGAGLYRGDELHRVVDEALAVLGETDFPEPPREVAIALDYLTSHPLLDGMYRDGTGWRISIAPDGFDRGSQSPDVVGRQRLPDLVTDADLDTAVTLAAKLLVPPTF